MCCCKDAIMLKYSDSLARPRLPFAQCGPWQFLPRRCTLESHGVSWKPWFFSNLTQPQAPSIFLETNLLPGTQCPSCKLAGKAGSFAFEIWGTMFGYRVAFDLQDRGLGCKWCKIIFFGFRACDCVMTTARSILRATSFQWLSKKNVPDMVGSFQDVALMASTFWLVSVVTVKKNVPDMVGLIQQQRSSMWLWWPPVSDLIRAGPSRSSPWRSCCS